MKSVPEKKLSAILNHQDPESILGFIQQKVTQLNQLNKIWQSNWPELAQYTRIANFREACLVIEVDNAAWATRLRYLIPELKKKLLTYASLSHLKEIEWYIQPDTHAHT